LSKVLIIDDEPSLREFLSILVRKIGYEVQTAADGPTGVALFRKEEFDVVFTDLKMPGGMDGIAVLKQIRELSPSTQVVVITAFATKETAIEAMQLGAYDYIQKPFKNKEVTVILSRCLEKRALLQENVQLRSELRSRYQFGNLIGKSPPMLALFDLLRKVSPAKTNILIQGESGTGKELVARAIHYNSDRASRPFVPVNCGAIPEALIESELFGHVKGAFTGAEQNKPGLFQLAHDGTLFLDEIGELPLQTQVKLLRVLQERILKKVGGIDDIKINVRVLAASNKRLNEEVEAKRFRQDLFYRLNVMTIELPPLRERPSDIPLLAHYFLKRYSQEHQKIIHGLSPEVMDRLMTYSYSGNVRELENIIERAVLLESSQMIQMESLPPHLRGATRQTPWPSSLEIPPEGLDPLLEQIEQSLLLKALEEAGGVRKDAARLLQITSRSLRYRLDKHNLNVGE